jgi:hypothetical protein
MPAIVFLLALYRFRPEGMNLGRCVDASASAGKASEAWMDFSPWSRMFLEQGFSPRLRVLDDSLIEVG